LTATLTERGLIAALLLWAVALPALAAEPVPAQPWAWGARWSVEADTNPLRLREGQAPLPGQSRDDTTQRYALTGALDESWGRQRLRADVALRGQAQANNTAYDATGWRASAAWDFATLERISGRLSASDERTQRPDLRDALNQLVEGSNPQTSRRAALTGRVGVSTAWSAEATAHWQRLRFTNPASVFRNATQQGLEAGLRWRPSGVGAAGLRWRGADARYPNLLVGGQDGVPGAEDQRQRRAWEAWAQWTPSGSSQLDLRLGEQRTRHERVRSRDANTPIAYAAWTWRPAGKLAWVLSAQQDAGQDADTQDQAFSRRTQTLRLRADYITTAKLSMYAEVQQQRRLLFGVGSAVAGARAEDREDAALVGARWQALRPLSLGCDAQWRRRSAAAIALLDENYASRSVRCDVQWRVD
jgi:hypothetical protein